MHSEIRAVRQWIRHPRQRGREAHLAGKVAEALMARAADLLAKPPSIEKVDVLAAKPPK